MFVCFRDLSAESADRLEKIPPSSSGAYGWIVVQQLQPGLFRYWSGNVFHRFEDADNQTKSESPNVYKSLDNARRAIGRIMKRGAPDLAALGADRGTIMVAYWLHDQFGYQALDYYREMTGSEFPGAPTQ